MKTISALKIGIRNIYESIGCGTDKVEDVSMITESNMLAYLGAIEERTNEILQMYDLCKHKVGSLFFSFLLLLLLIAMIVLIIIAFLKIQ